jgi:hypothetical protein
VDQLGGEQRRPPWAVQLELLGLLCLETRAQAVSPAALPTREARLHRAICF